MEMKRDKKEKIKKLTDKAMNINWGTIGEFQFEDRNAVYKGTKKGYEIFFTRIPEKRVRKIFIMLNFNENGEYDGLSIFQKYMPKRELKKYEKEAFEWLIGNGYVIEI